MNSLGISGLSVQAHTATVSAGYAVFPLKLGAYSSDPMIRDYLLDLGWADFPNFTRITRYLLYNHVECVEETNYLWLAAYGELFSRLVDAKKKQVFYELRNRYILESECGRKSLAKLPEFREVLDAWFVEQKRHAKKVRKTSGVPNKSKSYSNYGPSNSREYWDSVKNLRK